MHFQFEARFKFNGGWNDVHGALSESAWAELENFITNYFVFPLTIRVPFVEGIVYNLVGF